MRLRPTTLHIEDLETRTVPAAIDLTGQGAIANVGEVFFTQYDSRLADPGNLKTFVKLDGPLLSAAVVKGYNTDARPTQFNTNTSTSNTHSLRRSDIPAVTVGGVVFREFVLDASQLNLLAPKVSLDQFRIYTANVGNLSGYSTSTQALGGLAPVYDLDAASDNWIVLNLGLTAATGGADARVYVPDSVLGTGDYVYVFSQFGDHNISAGASVKWSYFTGNAAPAPTFTPVVPPSPPVVPPSPPVTPPPPASVARIVGTVFDDINGNATWNDDEYGLGGRVVYIDADGNGLFDEGELSQITDADGYYAFDDLAADATYTLRVVTSGGEFADSYDITPPDGWTITRDIGVESQTNT